MKLALILLSLLSETTATYLPSSSTTPSPPVPSGDWRIPFTCNFDIDWCGFSQDAIGDDFDWKRVKGPIGQAEMGPHQGDHTNGSGFYAYINASIPRKTGDLARIISPTLRYTSRCATLKFWYFAVGKDHGALQVRAGFPDGATPYSNWSIVFRISGQNVLKQWRQYQTSFLIDATFRVVFEGVVDNGNRGDYAIDDVSVESVECPNDIASRVPLLPGWAVTFKVKNKEVTSTPSIFGFVLPTNWHRASPKGKSSGNTGKFPSWAIALFVVIGVFILAVVLFFLIRHVRKHDKYGNSNKYSVSSSQTTNQGEAYQNHRVNVSIETLGRFDGNYSTEYGLGVVPRTGSIPNSLAPVPSNVTKEMERFERRELRHRARVNRSRLTVRQRRRMRVAAKIAAKAKKAEEAKLKQENLKQKTFSVLESDSNKFSNEPGKKRPIPLPPPHIMDMLMKMRSPNNPLNRLEDIDAENTFEKDGQKVVAIVEANRGLNANDLGIEDVDENDFGNDEDSEVESNESEIEEIVEQWEKVHFNNIPNLNAPVSRGKVQVISYSSSGLMSGRSSTATNKKASGLYDNLDDDDEDDEKQSVA